MLSDRDLFDEFMMILIPKVFDQCVAQEIDKSDDKFEFVNAVGRRTAFLAKQLMIERNRINKRNDDVFRAKSIDG